MTFAESAFLASGALFAGMVLCMEIGRRVGAARRARDPEGITQGSGPIEGAIFGLLGLLLAFTFSGAASRFEDRRELIAKESDIIGTTYLRVDLLPAPAQPEIRELFRRYTDLRIEGQRDLSDAAGSTARLAEADAVGLQIWAKSVAASTGPGALPDAAKLLLPSINEMIDITTARAVARENHPPLVIFALLGGLGLLSALLAGYVMSGTKVRSWLYQVLFAAAMTLTVYVILDLEYPRFGLIRIDSADHFLIEVRQGMN